MACGGAPHDDLGGTALVTDLRATVGQIPVLEVQAQVSSVRAALLQSIRPRSTGTDGQRPLHVRPMQRVRSEAAAGSGSPDSALVRPPSRLSAIHPVERSPSLGPNVPTARQPGADPVGHHLSLSSTASGISARTPRRRLTARSLRTGGVGVAAFTETSFPHRRGQDRSYQCRGSGQCPRTIRGLSQMNTLSRTDRTGDVLSGRSSRDRSKSSVSACAAEALE